MRILDQQWKNESEEEGTYVAIVAHIEGDESDYKNLISSVGKFMVRNMSDMKDDDGELIDVTHIAISLNKM